MATARKRASGVWRVRVYVGTGADGKRMYKSFQADTKKEAEFLASEYLTRRKNDIRAKLTLSEAYDRYIESKSAVLSPGTIREYKRTKKGYLQDIMDIYITDLTQEDIQKAINQEALKLSPKSVRNIHGLLTAVLDVFAPDFKIHTSLPQKKKVQVEIPDDATIKRMLSLSKGTELEVPLLLATMGPLRRGEICALTLDDVKGNTVTVSKSMVQNSDKEWVVKPPKTFAGNRTIAFPDFVIQLLKPAADGRLVSMTPDSLYNKYSYFLRKHGFPHYKFHALRHYCASMLHAEGVPDQYIMSRGGWSSKEALINIYQHTISDREAKITDQILEKFNTLTS